MTELLPCPFCGGQDLEIDHASTYDVHHPDVYEVHCPDCGGRGGEGWTEAEAIAAWNTRAAYEIEDLPIDEHKPIDPGFYEWLDEVIKSYEVVKR